MTWTKLPDEWTDRHEFAALAPEDRWHYLCLIVLASRGEYLDGVMPLRQAARASDHPDPAGALARLEEIGLVELSPARPTVRLVEIDMHIPPPSKRSDRTGAERQRRKRAHDKGDHSRCIPTNCPALAAVSVTQRDSVTGVAHSDDRALESAPSRVTVDTAISAPAMGSAGSRDGGASRPVTRDPGTGRDGTAITPQPSTEVGAVTERVDPATGEVQDLASWRWETVDGRRMKVPA